MTGAVHHYVKLCDAPWQDQNCGLRFLKEKKQHGEKSESENGGGGGVNNTFHVDVG